MDKEKINNFNSENDDELKYAVTKSVSTDRSYNIDIIESAFLNEEKSNKKTVNFIVLFYSPIRLHRLCLENKLYDNFGNNISTEEFITSLNNFPSEGVMRGMKNANLVERIAKLSGPNSKFSELNSILSNYSQYSRRQNDYKKSKDIYKAFKDNHDFYINYYFRVLSSLFSTDSEEIQCVFSDIYQKLSKALQTVNLYKHYTFDSIKQLAYIIYILIAYCAANELNFPIEPLLPNKKIPPRTLEVNDKTIQQNYFDYVSISEYYPVNTVERFAALKYLWQNDKNCYAASDLISLYWHGAVFWNISGTRKYMLNQDLNKANAIIKEIENSGKKYKTVSRLKNFIKNDIPDSSDYSPYITAKAVRLIDNIANLNNERKETIRAELIRIMHDEFLPVNPDAIFLLKELDKGDIIRNNNITTAIETNEDLSWIIKELSPYSNQAEKSSEDIPFIFIFFRIATDCIEHEKIIFDICSLITNNELEDFLSQIKNEVQNTSSLLLDSQKIANAKKTINTWIKINNIIEKVITKRLE